ncbi:gliding motility-associated C-terminal domain-containing protein [Chitinophaga sancti]|uniref:Gliding motility-associated C-terminal domain-containing protein n=1 Tax=Chitinophaga sancti TaxID=1004 RepID=A0ABZ0XJV7_9BACT|nr:gliding motility-associated C-terminal domain-containing protein [Chitinophaga sancti]WQD63442.1 gliding motility-associated C-terminal domain-containing protein [Chitinophaga sancti]WQG90932.1 gliding motility-associated C-terminal domain-containing protein [Chitinophaga sancti]
MKKILILLYSLLFLVTGITRAQYVYFNIPDTVCMSTNNSTSDQAKFVSMNAVLSSNQNGKASWQITTPNGTDADYTILYSDVNSTVKATQLSNTQALTIQFLVPGAYTFVVTMKRTGGQSDIVRTKKVVAVDCTIQTCSGGNAVMPGFSENFGVLPSNATRMAYSPSSAITYIYQSKDPLNDNYYAISNTTRLRDEWVDAADHSGLNRGGMLVANSDYTPSIFFQKEVNGLCRGSVYNFSAWLLNTDSSVVLNSNCVSDYKYAGVTFQVLNKANPSQILAEFKTYAVSMNISKTQWQRYGGSFTVPSGVTDVIVRIKNNFPGGCGNDIAVDDIEFQYCSPVITAKIEGQANNLKEVLCEGAPTIITSSYTPSTYFTNPEYQWEMSDDGGITWFNVPYGTANKDTLVIAEGELTATKNVAADYFFRVRIYESGSSAQTCAAPSSAVKITILPMPTLYLTKSQVCDGAIVELQASGGFQYFNWDDLPDSIHVAKRQIQVLSDTTIKVYGHIYYGIGDVKECVDSNSATILHDDKPIVEISGTPSSICVGNNITFSVNDALNVDSTKGHIYWYKGTDSTGTYLIDGEDKTSLTYTTQTIADTLFTVVVKVGSCIVQSAPFKVNLTEVPVPTPGKHLIQCVETGTGRFQFGRTNPTGITGTWSIIGVEGPAITDPLNVDFADYVSMGNPNNGNYAFEIYHPGTTVYLQWRAQAKANANCVGYAYDTMTLVAGATIASAGNDTTQCGTQNVFQMNANQPNIDGTGIFAENGAWTIISGNPANVAIADTSAYNTTVTITPIGTPRDVVLQWAISNTIGCATSYDTVILHYAAVPTVTLVPVTICNTSTSFSLDTTATTGNPTYYSIAAAGTNAMPGFSAVAETPITTWPIPVTVPAGVAAGTYDFLLTVRNDNGGCTNTIPFSVKVESPTVDPTGVTVGSPNICTTGTTTLTVTGGTLGKNPDGTDAAQWVWYAGGCGTGTPIGTGPTITVTVSATTTFYVRAEGTGLCAFSNCASGTVTVYTAPAASNAGPDQTHCNDSLFTMAANAATVGAGKWSVISGTVTIPAADSANPTANFLVLAGDSATLAWTITNGVCITSDQVVLKNYKQPVKADAGPDSIKNCNTTAFVMSATAASPATATGTWSAWSGSKAVINPADLHVPNARVTLPVGDTATLIWTVVNGTCSSVDSVKLFNYAPPTTADAGVDTIKHCMDPSFTMAANTPTIGIGKWSVKSGSAAIAPADSSKVNAVITVPNGSSAVLTWTVTNGTCTSSDDIVLINYQSPVPANAGLDSIVQCNNPVFTMAATAASPATAVGKWSLYPGSKANISPADTAKINAVINLPAGDTATAFWTVTNGVCWSRDSIFLRNYQAPAKPNVGADQVHCNDSIFNITITAPAIGAGSWTLSKATSHIVTSTTTSITIQVPAGDSVLAIYKVVNGTCDAADTVKLLNNMKPADADAGPDQHQCNNPSFSLVANTPNVPGASGLWSKPTGSTANFTGSPNSATTTVSIPVGDSSMLFWTITNGTCVDTDTMWIVNNNPPAAANAGPDTIKHCNTAAFAMTANAPSVAGATGTWTVVSPASYTIAVADEHNPTATFNVTAGNTVELRWTITNLGCTSADNIVLINYIQPTATSAGSNQTHCNDSIFTVTGSAPIAGAIGTWYIRSNNASFVGIPSGNTATVKVPAGQTATLRWVITNGICADSSTVTLLNNMQPVAADAGPDSIKNCNTTAFIMSATAASPATATGTWSAWSGSKAVINPADLNVPNARVTLPVGDTATLIWTVVNGTCSSVDSVKLFNYAPPTTADAGVDTIKHCMDPSFTMAANTPTIGIGKWSVKSGSAAIATTDSSKVNAVITVPNGSSAVLTWTVTNGTCTSSDDIVLINYQSPVPANAGLDSIVQCNNPVFTMAATAASPAAAVGKWSLYPGSKANISPADTAKINAVINLPAGDTATAFWTVTNGVCWSRDSIFLRNYQAPAKPNVGADQVHCNDSIFNITITAPAIGAGSWTLSKATSHIVTSTTTSITIQVPAGDSVLAIYKVVNGTCDAADTVKLLNNMKPADADAGPDQHQCNNPSFNLVANTPNVPGASGLWSKPIGSTANFTASPNSATTTISIPVGDSSMLFWTITNGTCVDTDTMWIVNNNPPAAANAGPDTIKHCNTAAFAMTANAPSVAGATGTWTVVSPATYTIAAADEHNPTATFNVTAGNTVELRWTITNLGCTSADNIVLINYEQPTAVGAGADQTKCAGTAFVTNATAANVAGAIGTWRVASGTAVITAGEEHLTNAHVTIPNGQSAVLHWVVTNGICADSAAVTLTNLLTPSAAAIPQDSIKHCNDSAFVMSANAPDVLGATGTWSFKGTALPSNPNDPNATIFVSAGDSVWAYWTISNGTCPTTDSIKLVNYMAPTAAALPADMHQCMTTTFPVTANAPDVPGAVGTWAVIKGSASFNPADLHLTSTTFTVANGDSAYITWTITNNLCSSVDTIKLYNYQQPVQADAGPAQIQQCNTSAFTMQATAASPATAVGKWSLYPGSKANNLNLADSTNPNAVFTLPAGDSATAIWTVTNGVCSSADVVLLMNSAMPDQANAGVDSIRQCSTTTFTMAANTPTVTGATGKWTLSNTRSNMAPADTSNPAAVITVPVGDSVIATWTITNGACATTDKIKLVNYAQPTTANAGPDQRKCATTTFTMAANTPAIGTGVWTLSTARANIANIDLNKPNAVITVPVGDSVIATWTITNGVCTTSDDVKLVNDAMPTTANAGPVQTHCSDSAFIMAANIPTVGTGAWSFYTGTKATIAGTDINIPTAKIFVPAGDTATAIWTITNNSCTTSSTVFLKNDKMPEAANAGPDQTHCNDSAFIMAATPGAITGSVGTWAVLSGTATFAVTDKNNPNAKMIVLAGTSATLQWTLSNGTCTGTPDLVTLTNLGPVLGNTISADQTLCASQTPAALTGTLTLGGGNGTFTYQWQMSTTSASAGFANVTTGTGGTAATYTPAALTADTVWFRRIVTSGSCLNATSNVVKLRRITTNPVVVSVPASLTTNCVAGKDYTTMFGTPVFSHQPFSNEALTVTYTDNTQTPDACHTIISRTWTATDRCGLTTTAQQTITVVDTTAPKFTTAAPANVTASCDNVPAAVTLTATDDCDGTRPIIPIETRVDIPGQCSSNYFLIRKWVAVDKCGNVSDTLRQTVTVKDTTGPVFNGTAPANVTVDCDKVPPAVTLTANDNCTPGTIIAKMVDTRQTISGAKCSNTYQLTRTWTATDNCGNSTILKQIITVIDTTRPVFNTIPVADTTVNCDGVPGLPTITATDNCTASVSVKVSQTKVFLSTTCSNNYRLTRTWTATDDCGNVATMKQVITVQDTTRPAFIIAPPADTTVSCSAVPTPPVNIKVTDNCSATSNVKVTYSQTRQSITGSCASNYQLIRVWTAKDECGNTNTVRQVITVVDTTKPVIDPAPAAVTVTCGGTIPAAATLYATDNCDGNFPKRATMTTDPYTVDACNGYTITRRWNVTDACGNAAIERVQLITVVACPKPALDTALPMNCSDNTKFALQLKTKVSKPTFTLQSVYPAGTVTAPKTQTSNVFDLNGATQATFIVTDGVTGCVSDPVTYNLRYVTKPTVNLGNDVAICEGSTVTLDAGAANASAGYTIKWSTGAATQQINVSTAGTYTATVTNNGCSATDTVKVTVNQPPVITLKDATICSGDSVKLNAYVQGASYSWNTGDTKASITVGTAGTYTVDVTLKGCTVTTQSTVTVSTPPNITLTPDTAICAGETVMLQVEPDGGTVRWLDGSLTNSIVVAKTGDYWVTVTKGACVVNDTVRVTNKGNINFDLGPNKDICTGGLVVLDATNPDVTSYLWNDGTTDPIKEVSSPGTYIVKVLDRFCNTLITDSVKVTVAGIGNISLGNDTTICIGQTLTLNPNAGSGNSIRWQDGATTPTYVVTTTGYYTVTVYNNCGTVSDDITVTYKACEGKPNFPNAFTPNGDGHNDTFKPIVTGTMYDYDLRIYNRWGEQIFLSKDSKTGWDGRYQGTLVDVGTYVWMLSYKKLLGGPVNVVKGEVTVIR